MKPFAMFRIPVLLLGLGAALVLSPVCKAQSEIAPDHFDGTDPWEAAARKAAAPKVKQPPAALQAQNRKADSRATLELAKLGAARDLAKPVRRDAVAIQDKRKMATRKSKKE